MTVLSKIEPRREAAPLTLLRVPRLIVNGQVIRSAAAGFAVMSFSGAAHSQEPDPPRVKAKSNPINPQDLNELSVPNAPASNISNSPSISTPKESEGFIQTKQSRTPKEWALLCLGLASTAGSMGWYYLSIRSKHLPSTASTFGLWATNDALLCLAAIATKQDVMSYVPLGLFALLGVPLTREAFIQSGRALTFTRFQKGCAAVCGVGYLVLLGAFATNSTRLSLATSLIGCALNIVASGPIISDLLARPKATDLTPDRVATTSLIRTVGPFALALIPLSMSFVFAGKELEKWLQPLVLTATSVCLTAAACIWAWRRLASKK